MRRHGHWLIVALAVGIGLLWIPVFQPGGQDSAPGTDLPWQARVDADGRLHVFGLTLGESRLAEAVARFGRRYELGLFRSAEGAVTAEAYFREAEPGGLTARLVLGLAVDSAMSEALLAHAGSGKPQPSGSWQFTPVEADTPVLMGWTVIAITYVPVVQLDEALIRERFGAPAERLDRPDGAHWLYPDRGLDLFVGADGKAVLQYVLPADFPALRRTLDLKPAG